MPPPRYLMVKSHVGFGDRLQCLSHAIHYALKYERTLCVDWGDGIWSDGTVDFHTYFDLCRVSLIGKAELLAAPIQDVEPLAWANQIERPAHSKFLYRDEYLFTLPDEDRPAQLLVYGGTGQRVFHLSNLCLLRVKREVRNRIVEELRRYAAYAVVVHLRGTDRVPPEKSAGYVAELFARMGDIDRREPILVLSDSLPLFQSFRVEFPAAVLRTPNLESLDPRVGTHMQGGGGKHANNLELLTDFFLAMYARQCFHDPNTLFSGMARFVRGGDYSSILGFDLEE